MPIVYDEANLLPVKSRSKFATLLLSVLTAGLGANAQEASINPGINESYLDPNLSAIKWVERFEREGREVYDNREAIVDVIGIRNGMSVADIGTGTGLFVPLLLEKAGSQGHLFAVDIVPDFLARVREQAGKNGWDNLTPVLCSERSVDLPPNSIDIAFICDVYHHFEYPFDSLASIRKALRPNGQLILVDFERIPGKSDEWILNHMRAGQETFEAEIQKSGFAKIEEIKGFLKDNYMVRFVKKG